MSAHATRAPLEGFTLIELTVGVFLAGAITLSTIIYFSAVSRLVARPVIHYAGQNYALAPIIRGTPDGIAKTDLFDALDLHQEFSRQIGTADFIAVFGGRNSTVGPPEPPPPLQLNFASPWLSSLVGASPQLLQTTAQIAGQATPDLLGKYETTSDVADFTVLVFQGVAEITAIAQVRRYHSSLDGTDVCLYETTLRARTPPVTTWTLYAYRFWLPVGEDNWPVGMGATHSWYRDETGWWNRHEPAGSTLAFPDPFVLSVSQDDAKVLGHSRFIYFVSSAPSF